MPSAFRIPATTAQSEIIQCTAGEAISAYNVVAFGPVGKVYKADYTVSDYIESVVGISTGAISQNATGPVQISGELENLSWSWTLDAPIYLGSAGVMTQTTPAGANNYRVEIGFPVTATKMIIKIGDQTKLAS